MTQAQTLARALNVLAKSPQFNYSKARASARQDGNVNWTATKARNDDFNAEVDGFHVAYLWFTGVAVIAGIVTFGLHAKARERAEARA